MKDIIIRKIENVLEKYKIEEAIYFREMYEVTLEDELYTIYNEYKNFISDFNLFYVGGFDSPGYEIECYALALIVEGKLYTYAINYETY